MNNLSPKQREQLQEFNSCFIEYPAVGKIFEDFDRLRLNKSLGGEPQCMLITGDTGVGKTALVNRYQAKFNHNISNGFVQVPILVSRIPPKPSLESTIVELLKSLGQFGSKDRKLRNNDQNLTTSLVETLKNSNVELIIICEFQELIEFKSGKTRSQIANRLKYINEDTGIPIVLVGMPWAGKIAEEPQWNSRLMIKRHLPYFKLSTGLQEFIRLLKGFAVRMPFDEVPKLETENIAIALFSVSRGCFRILSFILEEAVKQTFYDGANTMTREHLSLAFEVFYPGESNPFELEPEQMILNEVVEYSRFEEGGLNQEPSIIPTKFTDTLPLSQLLTK